MTVARSLAGGLLGNRWYGSYDVALRKRAFSRAMATPVASKKFPRTRHLFNLGSATRDDLTMEHAEVSRLLDNPNMKLSVEEKVDGANIGIRWLEDSDSFVAYNRSNPVNPETDLQFRQLGHWMESRRGRLKAILGGPRRILYGEWVAAKHCIHYTQLPDYLLAFDILDLDHGLFLSREAFRFEINKVIDDAELPIWTVPEIPITGGHVGIDELTRLCLQTQSQFYDGPVEGLYLRWDELGWLCHRAKIVRPGFQQAIEASCHWSKAKLVKNGIDFHKQWFAQK